MYIVAIGWMYVILMMSITENSVIAGIMTFIFYGLVPVLIILYLMGTPQRKRNRQQAEKPPIPHEKRDEIPGAEGRPD
jgi:biotin transporter BioY